MRLPNGVYEMRAGDISRLKYIGNAHDALAIIILIPKYLLHYYDDTGKIQQGNDPVCVQVF